MKTVLIIGAGGSLAQAQSYRRKQNIEHPPLDADFFQKARQLESRNRRVRESIRQMRDSIGRIGTFYDPWNSPSTSLEQFFADVYYETATTRSSKSFNLFRQLLSLYNRVLSITTNWMAMRDDIGVLGRLLRAELSATPNEPLTIITFNQDLVLENAISRLPRRLSGAWCLKSIYGDVNLVPLWASGDSVPVFQHHTDNCQHGGRIVVLKLHGSLNWGIRSRDALPALNTLFPSDRRRALYLLNRRRITMGQRMTTESTTGRSRWYLWPLVVPPIYDKQRITGMSVLQAIWDKARQAIGTADRLVLLGYSLPAADALSRQMLRLAWLSNGRLQCIECINPDMNLVDRLRRLLGCKAALSYQDIETYIKETRFGN